MALLYLIPHSPFDAVHHPYRIAAFAVPLVALWAAGGLMSLSKRWRRALPPLLILDFLFLSPVPYPLTQTPLPDVSIYAKAPPGPVLDFPPNLTTANRGYTIAQVHHGRPMAYGVNRFLSEKLKQDPLVHELLECIDTPQELARNRDIPPREPVLISPEGPHRGANTLHQKGFRSILLHHSHLSSNEARCAADLLRRYTISVEKTPEHSLWKTR